MAARKRKERNPEGTALVRGGGLRLVAATLLLAGMIVGVYFGWHHWARPLVSESHFKLLRENIEITPPPPWIKSDIQSEVFRDASLAETSTLDTSLSIRMADAFEMHPWVAKVHRVNKQSSTKLVIDLEYRKPIAWVKVPEGMFPKINGAGVLLIDQHAVSLPQDGFSRDDLGTFILIDIEDVSLCGPIGTPWGDARVAGAAKLAELLGENWRSLSLAVIRAVADYGQGGRRPRTRYEIITRKGKRLIWGSSPGDEEVGEPPAVQKLNALADCIRRHGPLDESHILGLDLRDPHAVRTAERPR
jgi:hypothetical protein